MDRKEAIELIEKFLAASMSGDKEGSRALVSPEIKTRRPRPMGWAHFPRTGSETNLCGF